MPFNKIFRFLFLCLLLAACHTDSSDGPQNGQGGSMTRFAIQNNFLYVVDAQSIKVFDISGNNFSEINTVSVGPGLETIFARGEYLYLGANDAMHIYSIADPTTPSFIFRYAHIVSCDPVIVQGNRAYVTLRTEVGNFCARGTNALDIIDITDPYHPTMIARYNMESPHGLGIQDHFLFVCEGKKGLKVLDVLNDRNVQLIKHVQDIHAYDVIVRNNLVTVTGDDGIFQYAFPDPEHILKLMSKIDVSRSEL